MITTGAFASGEDNNSSALVAGLSNMGVSLASNAVSIVKSAAGIQAKDNQSAQERGSKNG